MPFSSIENKNNALEIAEKDLIKGCLNGSSVFQRMLYKRYASKMLTLCWAFSGSREEAEDILQEGFMIVFEKLSQFKFEGSFEGWIRKIMLNKAIENHRKKSKMVQMYDIKEIENQLISDDDIIHKIMIPMSLCLLSRDFL